MSVEKTNKLGPGDPFPALKLQLMDGSSRQLPGDLEDAIYHRSILSWSLVTLLLPAVSWL